MNAEQEVRRVLDEILGLGGRSAAFTRQSYLLGAIPELDSMAVVSVVTALEERLGIVIDDADIDGSTFETFGSLVDFVGERLAA
jgi:acyl carrier protein